MTRLLNGAARSDILKVGGCHDIIVRNSPWRWAGESLAGLDEPAPWVLALRLTLGLSTPERFRGGLERVDLRRHHRSDRRCRVVSGTEVGGMDQCHSWHLDRQLTMGLWLQPRSGEHVERGDRWSPRSLRRRVGAVRPSRSDRSENAAVMPSPSLDKVAGGFFFWDFQRTNLALNESSSQVGVLSRS